MIQRADTIFLEELGQQVMTARGIRGMSRKTLAQTSGISERYIALLESGRGNISTVLLRRVSNAMAIPMIDLIPSGKPHRRWADADRSISPRAGKH
jgi:XRE family aerobic/anaerobic benzoate catabolism transcriptional regulator